MFPGRPSARPGRTLSHPCTRKKASPCRSTRSRPCPIQPHARLTSSPPLRHFSPPLRPDPTIRATPLETHAHPCYPRSREGPTPQPGNLHPNGIKPRASVGASVTGHWPPTRPCPALSRGATSVSQKDRSGITDLRRTVDTLSYEAHRMSQNRTEFTSPLRGNNLVGGAK